MQSDGAAELRNVYIIGSGLTAIATAAALVKRGCRPTILDAGIQPDDETADLKARLSSVEPEQWNPDDLIRLKRMGPASPTRIPRKLHFGSDFMYRYPEAATGVNYDGAKILRSYAQGGFSNVWGAVIQPLAEEEFKTWPVSLQELAPHYTAIRNFICPSEASVQPSTQARALNRDLTQHHAELEQEGVRFQYSVLAVRGADATEHSCRYCGLCLYGCPYDSIFTAASELRRMVRQGEVDYISGVLVDRVSAIERGIQIEARLLQGGAVRTFEGQRVFMAAGVLESARIVLNSTRRPAVSLQVRQSDIFTIPILRYHSTPHSSRERMHTLCQMIVEINDRSISSRPVQLQLYGYNDLYPQLLARSVGPFARFLRPLSRNVSERLFVAFGYLHSDVSSTIWITPSPRTGGQFSLRGELHSETHRAARAVVRKLSRLNRYFRAIPVPFQLRFDTPGGAHRSGGCFPMRAAPVGLETNRWGQIPGLAGIHIVDSSIVPSVPARPVAFTVMANAHRIASEFTGADVR